ncbi:MAG: hypothetical protein RIB78_12175 [Gammaproteobacteria bacterium]
MRLITLQRAGDKGYGPFSADLSLADRKLQGGLGIMLDDVLAALFSLFIIQITLYLL